LYIPKGIHPRVLNNITWDLRSLGIWVERHSYSYRIIYGGVIVGSIHIYPGYDEVVIRISSKYAELLPMIAGTLLKYLPRYKITTEYLRER